MAKKKKPPYVLMKDRPLEHCTTVREYEATAQWKGKSLELLSNHEAVCEICGRPRFKLLSRGAKKGTWKRILRFNVHHITYKNCPNENREDFMVLCQNCHDLHHLLRRCKNISPVYAELYDVSKKYFFYDGIETFKPW